MKKTLNKMFKNSCPCSAYIGLRKVAAYLRMRHKLLNDLHLVIVVVVAIIVEQVINAQAVCSNHYTINRYVLLQCPRCTHADDGKVFQFGVNGTAFKVNVDQCIQFV